MLPPLLSILICHRIDRAVHILDLIENLYKQINDNNLFNEVEVIIESNEYPTLGEKRNVLLNKAAGKFIVFVDDDDEVSEHYVLSIVECIKANPGIDCIGIQGTISFDGQNTKKWFISTDYCHWFEQDEIYYRTPNHISPVLREHAVATGFPSISFGEDADYSYRILPLLNKEAKVTKDIYHYKYISNKPQLN